MLKKISSILVVLIFNNSELLFAQKTYNLPGIITYFALDAEDVATIQSWDFASNNPDIKWKETQLQWGESNSTYFKSGTVQITVDGISYTFTLIMSGTKIVVNRVQFNLLNSASVPVFDLERIINTGGIIPTYMKCENIMPKSFGTLAYSLYIPKKKETWIAYSWQCLKGECSANINIYYEKEKVEKLPCY